jgi:hypothetical protein
VSNLGFIVGPVVTILSCFAGTGGESNNTVTELLWLRRSVLAACESNYMLSLLTFKMVTALSLVTLSKRREQIDTSKFIAVITI